MRDLPAEPAAAFDAWTTPSIMQRWLLTSDTGEIVGVTADPWPGGTYSILERRAEGEIDHYGTFTLVDRPRRLEFTLHVPAHFAESTAVSVRVEPAGGGSRLTFTQRGIEPNLTRDFWAAMLDDLAALLDG